MKINRFSLFCHLWAIGGFSEWVRWSWSETTWGWILVVPSACLFIFPNSVLALAFFAVVQIWFTTMAANSPWNHGLFMAAVNAAILLAIMRGAFLARGRSVSPGGQELGQIVIETLAPAVRLSLIVLYLFTFFHKLNVDFLNPEVSCAGSVLRMLADVYPGLPTSHAMVVISIWTTLIVELGVPILLCFRRTIYPALAIGFGFHLFLSQYGALFGFAAMIYAVYSLYLPASFVAVLNDRYQRLCTRLGLRGIHPGLTAMFLALVIGMGIAAHRYLGWGLFYAGRNVWDLWLLGALVLTVPLLLKLHHHPALCRLMPGWKPMLFLPLFTFLNGLSPYIGLKTETSWAMYSNLRTEVKGNHLLVPAAFKVFPYQDDRVEIIESTHTWLNRFNPETQVQLTFFEFHRYCSELEGDFRIVYRRNGKDAVVSSHEGVSSDAALTEPPPWLLTKLLRFRPVDVGPHATCRH